MGIEFISPTNIVFKKGVLNNIHDIVSAYGSRFLIVNIQKDNENPEGLEKLRRALLRNGSGCIVYDELIGQPDTEQIDSAVYFAKKSHSDCIIAYGGMDSINTAKAISLLVNNPQFSADLISNAPDHLSPAMSLITVPYEPAFGEELSGFFTLLHATEGTRHCFQSSNVVPRECIVDSELFREFNQDDAGKYSSALFTIILEKYFSPQSNIICDTLLLKSIKIIHDNMKPFFQNPGNIDFLEQMLLGSIFGGLAMMNYPSGLTWAASQVLSIKTKISFHHSLPLLLPYVLDFFITENAEKMMNLSSIFSIEYSEKNKMECAVKSIDYIKALFSALNIPEKLSEFYITNQDTNDLAKDIADFKQIQYSPKRLFKDEIEALILSAI